MDQTPKKWAVIGGGILGMTIAHRLKQQAQDVHLFEAAPYMGGLTAAWELGGATWDKYYHVILMSDTYTRNVLQELNLDEQIEWVKTKTGFYTDGKLHSMSNSIEFLQFPPLNLIDKFRLGGTIFYASKVKNPEKLEDTLVEDWLRGLSGNNTFEKIWLPLLRAKLGENYKQTSAAFIWATIQRMYAARRTGLKEEMFGYVPGGYATVLNTFVDKLADEGVNLYTDYAARRITSLDNGQVEVEFGNGDVGVFDEVIVTIPSHIASKMIEGLKEEETNKLNSIQYLGVVCASLLLKKSISPYYVTNVTDDDTPFTGVIEMTAMVDPEYFGGHHLVYLPKYVKATDDFYSKSDEEIRALFWGKLQSMYSHLEPNDLVDFQIARAKNVFALATKKYSETLPPISMSTPGVHVLNSSHIVNGTLNVNESIMLAEKQLPAIIQQSKQRPSLEVQL
ncbi:MAG: NAD(P)/FAD-dependent oxidoreductase [Bacteroidota bacterium]